MSDTLIETPTRAMEFSTINSVGKAKISIRSYGPIDGQPLVFAHGWTLNAQVWNAQINELATKYRVITYDQRGHGNSTMGTLPLHPNLLGHDLQAVISATVPSSKKAVIVGHSMGGMTIQAWAGLYPAEISVRSKALVLVGTGSANMFPPLVFKLTQPENWLKIARLEVVKKVMANTIWFPSGNLGRKVLRSALGRVAAPEHIKYSNQIQEVCSQKTRGSWGKVLQKIDVREGLNKINVPTVVVGGEQDSVLSTKIHSAGIAKTLSANNVLVDFHILPGCGHQIMIERGAELNRIIDELASAT